MLVGQFGNTTFSGQGYHYLLQKWVLQFYHINIKNQTFHRRKCLTKNFRSPGSDDNPDPRLAKNKLAVLTGVISRYKIFYRSFTAKKYRVLLTCSSSIIDQRSTLLQVLRASPFKINMHRNNFLFTQ